MTKDHFVDSNIVSAIKAFFLYGLPPGSCTELLLRGEYDEAKRRAHELIRDPVNWNNHLNFVEHLVPVCCRYEHFDTWTGYTNLAADEQEALLVTMTLSLDRDLAESWISEGIY